MNLYKNLQRKLEKKREIQEEEEQKKQTPWQINKNSRKIIMSKFKEEKPLYERTLDIAEKRKRNLENAVRINEIEKESEIEKMKTRWNSGKIKKEIVNNFIEKQKLWEQNKQTKVIMLREEHEIIQKKAIENTMFKPNFCKKSKNIIKVTENETKKVHERLYEYNDELKNKKQLLQKKSQPKFIPILNKKLPKYIKNNKNRERLIDLKAGENQINHNINNCSNFSNFCFEGQSHDEATNINLIDISANRANPWNNLELKNFKNESNLEKSKNKFSQNYKALIRINSAPINRSISNSRISMNTTSKPKLNEKDFELKKKGLKSDFNNIHTGKNIKCLLIQKSNEHNNKIDKKDKELKRKNSQHIEFKNISNKSIKRKLSDRLPIDKFSISIHNSKFDAFNQIDEDQINSNTNDKNYKAFKRLIDINSETNNKSNLFVNDFDNKQLDLQKNSVFFHQMSLYSPIENNMRIKKLNLN